MKIVKLTFFVFFIACNVLWELIKELLWTTQSRPASAQFGTISIISTVLCAEEMLPREAKNLPTSHRLLNQASKSNEESRIQSIKHKLGLKQVKVAILQISESNEQFRSIVKLHHKAWPEIQNWSAVREIYKCIEVDWIAKANRSSAIIAHSMLVLRKSFLLNESL